MNFTEPLAARNFHILYGGSEFSILGTRHFHTKRVLAASFQRIHICMVIDRPVALQLRGFICGPKWMNDIHLGPHINQLISIKLKLYKLRINVVLDL